MNRNQRVVLAVILVMILQATLPLRDSYSLAATASQEVGALSLPDGKVGQGYEYHLRSEGGLPPLTWRVVAGELPPGISLEASAKLRGVPSTPRREAYIFTIEVSDSSQPPQTFAQAFSLNIQASSLRIVAEGRKLKILPASRVDPVSPLAPNLHGGMRLGGPSAVATETLAKADANNGAAENVAGKAAKAKESETGKPATDDQTVKIEGRVTLASLRNRHSAPALYGKKAEEIKAWRTTDKLTPTEKKQKEFVETYLNNLVVQAQADDNTLIATTLTDANGRFELALPGIPPAGKKITISTEADDYRTRRTLLVTGTSPVTSESDPFILDIEDRPVSLLTRAVVGFSQAGASSAKADQNYFFDLYINKSVPFRQQIDPDFGERVRAWGDVRVASVPQQITTGIGEFAGGFTQNVANLKVNEIAQALEFLAGLEVRIAGNNSLLPSFDRETKQKFSLSLVAGFGTTTPIDPKSQIQLFNVFAGAPGLPPEAANKKFVAFVPSERDRFFRQYYAGFRINTFFFNRNNIPMQRFPTMLDIMYGQNEFVTGGRMRGGVFRLDSYFPLPFEQVRFINLFATALLRPGRSKITTPLILEPVDTSKTPVTVPGPDVAIVPFPQINRDYYRVGAGIDFISFVQALKNLGKKP